MGVFGGKYMIYCAEEFPEDWYEHAKLCHEQHVPELNYFGVNASLPLSYWRERGWIHADDPRGWFQWYCRYWHGRHSADDLRQISRWKAMRRKVDIPWTRELEREAVDWSHEKSKRCGRTAYQFAKK